MATKYKESLKVNCGTILRDWVDYTSKLIMATIVQLNGVHGRLIAWKKIMLLKNNKKLVHVTRT